MREATKHEFYMTGALAVSPNNEMLAWAEDTSGDEMFTLHIKDIASGRSLLDKPIQVSAASRLFACMRGLLAMIALASLCGFTWLAFSCPDANRTKSANEQQAPSALLLLLLLIAV